MSNPPKPTNLRILQGNPSKRPLPKNEPKPSPVKRTPAPPESLGEVGKKEWRRLARQLISMGLLTDLDITAFTAYCQTYERWQWAEAQIKEHGDLITTPNGMIQQSPYIGMSNRALFAMNRFLVQFGMTPSARTRIEVRPTAEGQSLEDKVFGRKAI